MASFARAGLDRLAVIHPRTQRYPAIIYALAFGHHLSSSERASALLPRIRRFRRER